MKITFEPTDEKYVPVYTRRTYDLHCPGCGRYCKLVTIRHHYNGWFDLMTQITHCGKCGEVSIELV